MTLAEMSVPLRRYVIAVVIGGPALAAIAALTFAPGGGLSLGGWLRALLLTILVAISYARPLRVAHKFSYDISDVVHVAMILLFPAWLPGILVGVAGAAHLLRRPGSRIAELFNVGQVMVYVTLSAA
ncbi:MAG TPA: hypothetical protein VFU81_16650, partial [Thermomicrobiales bacterium]|nr:hypothetical protein [Thermomicrobiales bacterium]